MNILLSLSFLLVFSLPIIAYNDANGGSYIIMWKPILKNVAIGNHWDEPYELNSLCIHRL